MDIEVTIRVDLHDMNFMSEGDFITVLYKGEKIRFPMPEDESQHMYLYECIKLAFQRDGLFLPITQFLARMHEVEV